MNKKYLVSFLFTLLGCLFLNCGRCKNADIQQKKHPSDTSLEIKESKRPRTNSSAAGEQKSKTTAQQTSPSSSEPILQSNLAEIKQPPIFPITYEMIERAKAGNGDNREDWDYLANMLKELETKGSKVDINKKNKNHFDYTALHYAVDMGDIDIIRALLDRGADIHAQTESHSCALTPLHHAARVGNKELIEVLIAHGANKELRSLGGLTPLQQAVKSGNQEAVAALIANGANISTKDDNGWTPIYQAVLNNRKKVAELLLEQGAKLDVKDNSGWSPAHAAIWARKNEMLNLLLANEADQAKAAEKYKKELVEIIMASNNPFVGRVYGNSLPLHLVILYSGSLEITELLIANGVDINAQDKNGLTPLHLAAKIPREKIAEVLIANKADVNARDCDGKTPLEVAESKNHHGSHDEVIALLTTRKNSNS